MLRQSTALAIVALFTVATIADAGPTTAKVDVDIRDIILVSTVSGGTPPAGTGAGLAGFWNASTPGSISTDGAAIIDGKSDPNFWGDANGDGKVDGSTRTTVNSTAARSGHTTVGGVPISRTEPTSAVATPGTSSFSPSKSGALIHESENPAGLGGDFTAHGRAEISNAFAANVLADVSAVENATQTSFASANNTNSVFSINLASAATIAAANGGSSIFTIQLFIDTVLAEIDLVTDGPGSTANAEFTLTATLVGFTGTGNTGGLTGFGFNTFGDTQNAQDGSSVMSVSTGSGPSTTGGVGAIPFVSLTVDAATTRSIKLDISLTSSAQVTTPTPEPTSLALFATGLFGFGASRIRRRRKVAAQAAA